MRLERKMRSPLCLDPIEETVKDEYSKAESVNVLVYANTIKTALSF